MNSIKAFSICKLKIIAVLSIGIFVLLPNHEIYAEETTNEEKSENVQNSISPEKTEKYEEIIVSDEVIPAGEDYDLTDNIVNGNQVPIIAVIDITPAGSVNNEMPGQYTGTISVVLEDGSTQQMSVNIVIEATEPEREDFDEPEIENPESGDSEKDLDEEQSSEEGVDEEETSEEEKIDETDKETGIDAEKPDVEGSKEDTGNTDEETSEDSDIPEEVEGDVTEHQNPTETENSEEENMEQTEEDVEQKTDPGEEGFVDEDSTSEEEEPSDEELRNSETDNNSQEEIVEESPKDTEANDTSEEIEIPEIPQDRGDSERTEENDDADEEATGINESDEEIIETTPHFTEIKESSKTDEYLSDYLSEEAAADIIGEIDIDFEKSSEEEIKQEITRSLLRYLSDMQRDQQYYAVTPPISRVITKGGNSLLRNLDGLYPLNLDKQFNQGDFTIGDRLQWVAISDYTRQSPTPSSRSLYLLDGKNPLNQGHFEVKYIDGENFSPSWQVSLGAEHHLENIKIVFSPGEGPNGANWTLREDGTITIQPPDAFRNNQHILVGKRFWEQTSTSENNISSYVDDHSTLLVNVKMLEAGEHLMFTVQGMALTNEKVHLKNHFIADARLTADLYM